MPLDNAQNGARGTLASGITSGATSVSLTAGHGARMPSVPFNAWLYNATDYGADPHDDPGYEIVRVTARSTDTLTITRAQEGTTASAHNTGGKTYRLVAGLTAKTVNQDLSQNGSYRLESFNASGSITTTTGSITSGTPTLTVASATTFSKGQGIFVAGAGGSGTALVTTISSISGNTLTLATNATATVSSVLVQHDDTVAIQTALNTAVNAGGGTIWFAPGFYRVNGPFQSTNSILNVPYIPIVDGSPIAIKLTSLGPVPWFSFGGPVSNGGVIIQSDKIGVNQNSAIFAAATWVPGTDWTSFTNVVIYMDGLQFRTYDNPQISALDLGMAGGAEVRNCWIETGIRLQYGAEPTGMGFGFRMPRTNTPTGYSFCDRVMVQNYPVGFYIYEVQGWNNLLVLRCKTGFVISNFYHRIAGSFATWQCPTIADFSGLSQKACLNWECAFENAAPAEGWYSPLTGRHFYDPNNQVHGIVDYSSILSGTGADVALSNTGMTSVVFTNIRT
jgi:hypothetical protein